MAGNVVNFIINSVFNNRGVQAARQAIANLGRTVSGAVSNFSNLVGPFYLASTAVQAWGKVVKEVMDAVNRRWKESVEIMTGNWRAGIESMKESFKRIFDYISQGWDELGRKQKNSRALEGVLDNAQMGAVKLKHEREISDMIDNGASEEEVKRRRQEQAHEQRMLQLDQKKMEIARKRAEVEERRRKRAEDTALIDNEIIPDAERKMREASAQTSINNELANSDGIIDRLTGKVYRATNEAKERAKMQHEAASAAANAIKEAEAKKKKMKADEEEDAALLERLRYEERSVEYEREREEMAETNRKTQQATADAQKRADEERRKADEEAKEARQKAIDGKREEIQLEQDAMAKRRQAARETADNYRDQIAAAKEALRLAQEAAKAQMPTNADIRAERTRRKQGGYGGGDLGEDGIAGTWDDEKAVKRAERIAAKIRRNRGGGLGGRLSKEDQEFYKQWFEARKGALDAKALAKQKEALMIAAQNAEIQAAADLSKMQGDIAALRQDLNALLKSK